MKFVFTITSWNQIVYSVCVCVYVCISKEYVWGQLCSPLFILLKGLLPHFLFSSFPVVSPFLFSLAVLAHVWVWGPAGAENKASLTPHFSVPKLKVYYFFSSQMDEMCQCSSGLDVGGPLRSLLYDLLINCRRSALSSTVTSVFPLSSRAQKKIKNDHDHFFMWLSHVCWGLVVIHTYTKTIRSKGALTRCSHNPNLSCSEVLMGSRFLCLEWK